MLEALVAFLVPLEVPDHLLLLAEHLRVALQAVEVFSVEGGEGGAVRGGGGLDLGASGLLGACGPSYVSGVREFLL